MRVFTSTTFLIFAVACGPDEPTVNRLTPDVTVAPSELIFGDVVPGFVVEQTFHVVNAGRSALEISDLSLSTGPSFEFDYEAPVDDEGVPLDPISLERSETMAVTVKFSPENLDDYTGQVVISSNDEDASASGAELHRRGAAAAGGA